MKKVLLATSLVAFSATGALAQNVTIGGDGRMGVQRLGVVGATNSVQGRVRVNFNLRREGDNGLTFGGTLRLTQSWVNGGVEVGSITMLPSFAGGTGPFPYQGPRNGSVFIEGGGLRLTMGDINGAVAHRVAIYGGGLGFTGAVGRPATHVGLTEDDTGVTSAVRADFSFEGFTASASYRPTQQGSGEIAVGYSMSGITVALGYRQGRNIISGDLGPSVHLSASYTAGDITVGALVSQRRLPGVSTNRTSWRVWGTYDIGDIRLGLTHTVGDTVNATAIGARYSLGGGAFLHGAIETRRGRPAGSTSRTGGEIGVTFAF